jgi:hypothetical protein
MPPANVNAPTRTYRTGGSCRPRMGAPSAASSPSPSGGPQYTASASARARSYAPAVAQASSSASAYARACASAKDAELPVSASASAYVSAAHASAYVVSTPRGSAHHSGSRARPLSSRQSPRTERESGQLWRTLYTVTTHPGEDTLSSTTRGRGSRAGESAACEQRLGREAPTSNWAPWRAHLSTPRTGEFDIHLDMGWSTPRRIRPDRQMSGETIRPGERRVHVARA